MAEMNMVYVMEKHLGIIGSKENSSWKEVEIGHYEEDGDVYGSKLYVFDAYRKRNGSSGRRCNGKFTLEEAKDLFELLKEVVGEEE